MYFPALFSPCVLCAQSGTKRIFVLVLSFLLALPIVLSVIFFSVWFLSASPIPIGVVIPIPLFPIGVPGSHPIIFMIVSAVFFVFSNILFALLPLIGSLCLNALPLAAFIR